MIRLHHRIRRAFRFHRPCQRAIRPGQARRLSGQRHPHLRQLPHAQGPDRRHHGQGLLRRAVVGRAAVQGDGAQYHAGQRDRHRQLDRRADQDAAAHRHPPQRRAHRHGHADRLLSHHDRARSRRGRRLSAHHQADQEQGGGAGLQDAAGRARTARRREAVHRSDAGRQAQERLLSRHHRALHGMPHADGEGRAPMGHAARRRRLRLPRPVGRLDLAQHHLEQDQGHRRLERRRDQARHHHRRAARTAAISSRRWASITTRR